MRLDCGRHGMGHDLSELASGIGSVELANAGIRPCRALCVHRKFAADPCPSAVQGRDATYWHQVSVTLCGENELLRRELDMKADSYRVLQELHVRLSSAYQGLNAMIAAVRRDNVILKNRVMPGKQFVSIPSNTQGKDAVFWHQCARTLQRQYQEVSNQLLEVCTKLSECEGN